MARRWVEEKLVDVLGQFIDGLERESINLALWSGRIELSEVKLKQSALATLRLPFPVHLVVGSVKTLVVEINWRNITASPVTIELDGIVLEIALLSGDAQDPHSTPAYISRRTRKQARVHRCEGAILKSARPEPSLSERISSSLSSHMATKILRNLKVSITSLQLKLVQYYPGHIAGKPDPSSRTAEVEFSNGMGRRKCSAFLTMDDTTTANRRNEARQRVEAPSGESAVVLSLDGISVDCIVPSDSDVSKRVDVRGLCVKVRLDESACEHDLLASTNAIAEFSKNSSSGSAGAGYVVKLRLHDGLHSTATIPEITFLGDFCRNVGEQQRVAQNACLRDSLARHARWCRHRRPNKEIREGPREWWKYALCVIKRALRCCNEASGVWLPTPNWLRWERLIEEIRTRLVYIALYQRVIIGDYGENDDREMKEECEKRIDRLDALSSWRLFRDLCPQNVGNVGGGQQVDHEDSMDAGDMLHFEDHLSTEQILLYRAMGRMGLLKDTDDGGATAQYVDRCALAFLPAELNSSDDADDQLERNALSSGFALDAGLVKFNSPNHDVQVALEERRQLSHFGRAESEYGDCMSSDGGFLSPTPSEASASDDDKCPDTDEGNAQKLEDFGNSFADSKASSSSQHDGCHKENNSGVVAIGKSKKDEGALKFVVDFHDRNKSAEEFLMDTASKCGATESARCGFHLSVAGITLKLVATTTPHTTSKPVAQILNFSVTNVHLRHETDSSIDRTSSRTTLAIQRIRLYGAETRKTKPLLKVEHSGDSTSAETFQDLSEQLWKPAPEPVEANSEGRALREACALWVNLNNTALQNLATPKPIAHILTENWKVETPATCGYWIQTSPVHLCHDDDSLDALRGAYKLATESSMPRTRFVPAHQTEGSESIASRARSAKCQYFHRQLRHRAYAYNRDLNWLQRLSYFKRSKGYQKGKWSLWSEESAPDNTGQAEGACFEYGAWLGPIEFVFPAADRPSGDVHEDCVYFKVDAMSIVKSSALRHLPLKQAHGQLLGRSQLHEVVPDQRPLRLQLEASLQQHYTPVEAEFLVDLFVDEYWGEEANSDGGFDLEHNMLTARPAGGPCMTVHSLEALSRDPKYDREKSWLHTVSIHVRDVAILIGKEGCTFSQRSIAVLCSKDSRDAKLDGTVWASACVADLSAVSIRSLAVMVRALQCYIPPKPPKLKPLPTPRVAKIEDHAVFLLTVKFGGVSIRLYDDASKSASVSGADSQSKTLLSITIGRPPESMDADPTHFGIEIFFTKLVHDTSVQLVISSIESCVHDTTTCRIGGVQKSHESRPLKKFVKINWTTRPEDEIVGREHDSFESLFGEPGSCTSESNIIRSCCVSSPEVHLVLDDRSLEGIRCVHRTMAQIFSTPSSDSRTSASNGSDALRLPRPLGTDEENFIFIEVERELSDELNLTQRGEATNMFAAFEVTELNVAISIDDVEYELCMEVIHISKRSSGSSGRSIIRCNSVSLTNKRGVHQCIVSSFANSSVCCNQQWDGNEGRLSLDIRNVALCIVWKELIELIACITQTLDFSAGGDTAKPVAESEVELTSGQSGGVEEQKETHPECDVIGKNSGDAWATFPIVINGEHIAVIFPRDSMTCELAAVKCTRLCIALGEANTRWPLPGATPQLYDWLFDNLLVVPGVERYAGSASRKAISLEGTRMFTSCFRGTPELHSNRQRWLDIDDGEGVYASSEGPLEDRATWDEITDRNSPLHLRVLFDAFEGKRQILVASSPDANTPFRLQLTMAQYCSLLCVWHCNMNEGVGFKFDPDAEGPATFCEYLRDEAVYNDTVVSLPHVDIEFSMHSGDFSHLSGDEGAYDSMPIMRTLHLARAMGFHWRDVKGQNQTELHKFARLRAECLLVRVASGDEESMKVCVSAEAVELRDLRPHFDGGDESFGFNGIERQVLCLPHGAYDAGTSVAKVNRYYPGGRMHADFGIDEVYDYLLLSKQQVFQVNIFMTPRHMRVAVGLDEVDIATEDLNLVWLITEFTSAFYSDHRLPHPGVLPQAINQPVVNRELDVRVWATKPHLRIVEDIASKSTQAVLLETEKGFFVQYLSCPDLKEKTAYKIVLMDVAVILLKHSHCDDFPFPKRHIRGQYGAGNLAVTLLEGCSLYAGIDMSSGEREDGHLGVDLKLPVSEDDLKSTPLSVHGTSHFGRTRMPPIPVVPGFQPQSKIFSNSRPDEEATDARLPQTDLVSNIDDLDTIKKCIIRLISKDHLDVSENFGSDEQTLGIGGHDSESDQDDDMSESDRMTAASSITEATSDSPDTCEPTLLVVIQIRGLRAFIIDPVLGFHFPIAKLCFEELLVVYDRSSDRNGADNDAISEVIGEVDAVDDRPTFANHAWVYLHISADYFNNHLNYWEPLLEPFQFNFIHELCGQADRGVGTVIDSRTPLHLNVTTALLETWREGARRVTDRFNHTTQSTQQVDERTDGDGSVQRLTSAASISTSSIGASSTRSRSKASPIRTPEQGPRNIEWQVDHSRPPRTVNKDDAFLLLNNTGVEVRILQASDEPKHSSYTYIEPGGKSALPLAPTMTVIQMDQASDNSQAVSFDVQRQYGTQRIDLLGQQTIKLQLLGLEVQHDVQVDGLRCTLYFTKPLLPQLSLAEMLPERGESKDDQHVEHRGNLSTDIVRGALCLAVDVQQTRGGVREITLRSVFVVENCTEHAIELAMHPGRLKLPYRDQEFQCQSLAAHEDYCIPISLLYSAANYTANKKRNKTAGDLTPEDLTYTQVHVNDVVLGFILIRPEDADALGGTLEDDESAAKQGVAWPRGRYCEPPVDLASVISATFSGIEATDTDWPIGCHPKGCEPFYYCVEVQATQTDVGTGVTSSSKVGPMDYRIKIHPPLCIENLLAESAEIHVYNFNDKINQKPLWRGVIQAGDSAPIYSVGTSTHLSLYVELKQHKCKTPISNLTEIRSDRETNDVLLLDQINQKLLLKVAVEIGLGKQRRFVLFCPYWIVNRSQYVVRYKQEHRWDLPAGTVPKVAKGEDGAREGTSLSGYRCFPGTQPRYFFGDHGITGNGSAINLDKEPLANDEFIECVEQGQAADPMSEEELTRSSFMFNYDTSNFFASSMKIQVEVELKKGKFSDWSSAFSPRAVGVNQTLKAYYYERRQQAEDIDSYLEMGLMIYRAPGRRSLYTRVVHLTPRFVVVNRLKKRIRMMQTNEFGSYTDIIIDAPQNAVAAFHLPRIGGGSLVKFKVIDMKAAARFVSRYVVSSPVPVDVPDEFYMRLKRLRRMQRLNKESYSRSGTYQVIVKTKEKYGLGLETTWDNSAIVIKEIKAKSPAATISTIADNIPDSANVGPTIASHEVGDELIQIDDDWTLKDHNRRESLDILKKRMSGLDFHNRKEVILTFKTKQERMLDLRAKALKEAEQKNQFDNSVEDEYTDDEDELEETGNQDQLARSDDSIGAVGGYDSDGLRQIGTFDVDDELDTASDEKVSGEDALSIHLELKPTGPMMVMILTEPPSEHAPYKIVNRCTFHSLVYRQKGTSRALASLPWEELGPGQDIVFTLHEADRDPELQIQARQVLAARKVVKRDTTCCAMSSASVTGSKLRTIKLNQIGEQTKIKIDETRKTADGSELRCWVEVEGATRALVVAPNTGDKDSSSTNEATAELRKRLARLQRIREGLQGMMESESAPSRNLPTKLQSSRALKSRASEDYEESPIFGEEGSFGTEDPALRRIDRQPTMGRQKRRAAPQSSVSMIKEVREALSDLTKEHGHVSLEEIIAHLKTANGRTMQLLATEKHCWADELKKRVYNADVARNFASSTSQLKVEVVRARDLKATYLDGYSHPFAMVHLDDGSSSFLSGWKQTRQRTNYVSKTLNPVWNETFIFDVPIVDNRDPRAGGLSLHVNVYDFTAVRLNDLGKFLGHCKIPLEGLISDEERATWGGGDAAVDDMPQIPSSRDSQKLRPPSMARRSYSPKPTKSKVDTAQSFHRISECDHVLSGRPGRSCISHFDDDIHGTIFVRAQWIHNPEELLLYHFDLAKKEEQEIEARLKQIEGQRAKLMKEKAKRHNIKRLIKPKKRKGVEFDLAKGFTQIKSAFRIESIAKFGHKQPSHAGVGQRSKAPSRKASLPNQKEKATLKGQITQKMQQTFARLANHEGTLSVKPLEAKSHSQVQNQSVFVRAHYEQAAVGSINSRLKDHQRSGAVRAAWHGAEFLQGESPFEFVVDTYQPRDLRISLCCTRLDGLSERILCSLDIPIISLVDTLISKDEFEYVMWFSMTKEDLERRSSSNPGGRCLSDRSEQADPFPENSRFDSVKLSLKWVPTMREDLGTKLRETRMYASVFMDSVAVSIISNGKTSVLGHTKELLQLTVSGIQAQVHNTSDTKAIDEDEHAHAQPASRPESWAFGGIIDWIQLDSQDPHITEPVVLAPTPMLIHKPTFATIFEMTVRNSKRLYHVSYMGALLQELSLNLEQRDMMNVIAFLTYISEMWEALEPNEELPRDGGGEVSGPVEDEKSGVSQTSGGTEPSGNTSVYIEYLKLNPVKINLSFLKSIEDDQVDFSQELVRRMVGKSTISKHQQHAQGLRFIVDLAMAVTSTISDAPIKLKGMILEHIYKPPGRIRDTVVSHYFQSIMWELGKFCNFDFLGNPVSFAKSLGTGLTEFFVEPYQGMLNSPGAFASGVFKGSRSLVQHTATGVFGAVESITEWVGTTVNQNLIQLDAEFKQQRLRKTKLKCGSMLRRPFYDIGYGIFYGASGIVRDPFNAWKNAQGCTEKSCAISKGCVYGVVGLAAKPVVGFLDAASHTAELLSFTLDRIAATPRLNPMRRCRDAHVFGPGGRLLHYEPGVSRGGAIIFDRNIGHNFGIVKAFRDFGDFSGVVGRSKSEKREECMVTAEFIVKQLHHNEMYALVVTTKKLVILQGHRDHRQMAPEAWDPIFTVAISGDIKKRERDLSAFQHFNDRPGHICELHLDKGDGAMLTFRHKKIHTDIFGHHKLIRVYFCVKVLNLNLWMLQWQRKLEEPHQSHSHDHEKIDVEAFVKECDEVAKIVEELKEYEYDISPINLSRDEDEQDDRVLTFGSWNMHSPKFCGNWASKQKELQKQELDQVSPIAEEDDDPENDVFNTWKWTAPPNDAEVITAPGQDPAFVVKYNEGALKFHNEADKVYTYFRKVRREVNHRNHPEEIKWTTRYRSGAVDERELKRALKYLHEKAKDIEILRSTMGSKDIKDVDVAQMRELMKGHVMRRKTLIETLGEETAPQASPGVAETSDDTREVAGQHGELPDSPAQAISPLSTAGERTELSTASFAHIESRLDIIERLLQSKLGPPSPDGDASLLSQNVSLSSQNDVLRARIDLLEAELSKIKDLDDEGEAGDEEVFQEEERDGQPANELEGQLDGPPAEEHRWADEHQVGESSGNAAAAAEEAQEGIVDAEDGGVDGEQEEEEEEYSGGEGEWGLGEEGRARLFLPDPQPLTPTGRTEP